MLSAKIVRSLFAVLLTCVIALNTFVSPAFAANDSAVNSNSWVNRFWQGFVTAAGGLAGTVVTCYAVDVLIAPVNPAAAAYVATVCPAIGVTAGATAGGVGSAAGAGAMIGAH